MEKDYIVEEDVIDDFVFEEVLENCENGSADALDYYNLGNYYLKYGDKADVNKAIKAFRRSAELGLVEGCLRLYDVLYNTPSASDDDKVACLTLGTEMFIERCMIDLGKNYLYGYLVEKDIDKAIEILSRTAYFGSAEAAFELASVYQDPSYQRVDLEKSLALFEKAGKLGYGEGYFALGYKYEEGVGVDKSVEKAIDYYTKGIDLNSTNCALRIINLSNDTGRDLVSEKLVDRCKVIIKNSFFG